MKRMLLLVVTVLTVLNVVGCAGIPTSGPVNPGSALVAADTSTIEFFPAGPVPDATQEQILRGFLEAASGPQNDYAVAKQFLTPEFQAKWDPNAGVSIDSTQRTITMSANNSATLISTVSATIDATGQYTELAAPTSRSVGYTFAQVSGQWRVASAPQGVILERSIVDLIYRTYPIYFFEPSYRYLVPDVRWFARASATTTRITKALLAGPAPWLGAGNAVVTSFPVNAGLVANSVPVLKDVATADFTSPLNAADPTTVMRMKQQLTASLVGVNSVVSVDMYVEGVPLGQGLQAFVDAVTPPAVDSRPFVVAERGIGYLDGDLISPVQNISPALTGSNSAVTIGAGNRYAVSLSGEGVSIVRPATGMSLIDSRPGLIAPSMDRFNYVWSVPRTSLAELLALSPDGSSAKVSVPWVASSVTAIKVSHDGARVAVLFTDATGPKLFVASVIRGDNGVPQRLGGSVSLQLPSGTPVDIAWVDGTTVAVLTNSGSASAISIDEIGGRIQSLPMFVLGNAVSISGGNNLTQLRLLNGDGRLYNLRSTSSWSVASIGIKVLGVLQ